MTRRKLTAKGSAARGLPPGSTVYVGEDKTHRVAATVIDYDSQELLEKPLERGDECAALQKKPTVTWVNVDGVHDVQLVESIGSALNLHPLVVEDILHTDQRAKMEDLGEYMFIVLKMMRWDQDASDAIIEQVSLILKDRLVVSFQERLGDVFDPIRERIRHNKGRIRGMRADYLAYCLLDAILDGYFVVLERLGEQIEELEDEVIARPSPETLRQLYRIRREGFLFRRSVWPVRELVGGLHRAESSLVGADIQVYLRDLYDHAVQAIDTTETFREMVSGMLDTYLSSLSNRMNEVMKVLTIIATIFIPLSFIAGVYGMNFAFMPELKWPWAYPALLILMACVGLSMVVYFWRKKWL